ncbi:type IX secretion system membrane protein PorP/SprF [Rubrolithibacter danxiaensis]|uniref:type IX secretion system membrane protein PorP/SprF n=1 Tax=Rubrolithibacter danxiaensis TaxID=3390805 RepID=UPI003BF89C3C
MKEVPEPVKFCGILRTRLNTEDIIGSPNDALANQFNMQEETLFDADFGISYTSERLTVQAAAYNMKTNLQSEQNSMADYGMFYGAISYRLDYSGYSVEPKVVYQMIKNFKSVLDAGAELVTFQNQIKLLGMYHTNGSTTTGLGYLYNSKYQILGLYNTAPEGIKNYTVGTFELGLQMRVADRKH